MGMERLKPETERLELRDMMALRERGVVADPMEMPVRHSISIRTCLGYSVFRTS